MIAFRRAHPVLSEERFYTDAEIQWLGRASGSPNWFDPKEKALACAIRESGQVSLLLMFNAGTNPADFVFPPPSQGFHWHLAVDTSAPRRRTCSRRERNQSWISSKHWSLKARSSAIFVARRAGGVVTNIQRILLPVALPEAFTDSSRHALHQAAWLARRFHAEIILLHVVTPLSYPYGALESGHEITVDDLHAQAVQRAQKDLDQAMLPEFQGVAVTRLLLRGDPAQEIVETARGPERRPDRYVDPWSWSALPPSAGIGDREGTARNPVPGLDSRSHWKRRRRRRFSIRRILCSVELNGHSRHTVSLAAEMAAAVDATLTLVHITSSVETFGPGGPHINAEWKKTIVGIAADEIAELQTGSGHEGRSHHR